MVVEKDTVTNSGVALLHGCACTSGEPWFPKISISMQSTSATWVQAAAQMHLQLAISAKLSH